VSYVLPRPLLTAGAAVTGSAGTGPWKSQTWWRVDAAPSTPSRRRPTSSNLLESSSSDVGYWDQTTRCWIVGAKWLYGRDWTLCCVWNHPTKLYSELEHCRMPRTVSFFILNWNRTYWMWHFGLSIFFSPKWHGVSNENHFSSYFMTVLTQMGLAIASGICHSSRD